MKTPSLRSVVAMSHESWVLGRFLPSGRELGHSELKTQDRKAT